MAQAEGTMTETEIETLRRQVEALTEQLEKHTSPSKTGLVFEDVPEAGDYQKLAAGWEPSLKEIPSLSLQKPDISEPQITLIAGDNISSLAILESSHSESIDIIYADPPYNTGKASFTYNDRRKASWLSFMERRLTLAAKLLKPGGAIFLSIDDSEHARLKLLMDDIFGEQNFVANLIWKNSSKSGSSKINRDHEYVLCYTKQGRRTAEKWRTVRHADQIAEMYKIADANMKDLQLATELIRAYVNDLIKTDEDYTWLRNYSHVRTVGEKPQIYYTVDLSVPGEPNRRELKDGTVLEPLPDRGWQSADRIDKLIDEGLVDWKSGRPYQISPLLRKHRTGVSSVLPKIYTRNGKEELKRIFGKQAPFDFPKPVSLIKILLSYTNNPNAVILDFFAGSGTTGQAVAELNSEDGGNRECFLLTSNTDQEGTDDAREHKIAETVTAVRMRRVLSGEGWSDGKPREPLRGQLRYYETVLTAPDSEPR